MGKEVGGGGVGGVTAGVGNNAPRRPGAFSFTEGAAGSAIQAHLIKIKQDGSIVRRNSLTPPPLPLANVAASHALSAPRHFLLW